jgi:hypothetical protein
MKLAVMQSSGKGNFIRFTTIGTFDRLKAISDRIGGLMIPNKRSYTRFVDDAHANIEGNLRMAEDIFDFLITNEETSRVLRRAQQQNKDL